MKVVISVANGWFAQSRSIQPKTPRRVAGGHGGRGQISGGHGRFASASVQASIQAGSGRSQPGTPIAAITRSGGTMPSALVTALRMSALETASPPAVHRLRDVEEAGVAADEGRAHRDAVEGADPAAVADRGAGDREAPAIGADGVDEAGAGRERHPPEVVEGEGAAVVELHPRVDVPRPAGVVRDVDVVEGEPRRPGGEGEFDAEAEERVHGLSGRLAAALCRPDRGSVQDGAGAAGHASGFISWNTVGRSSATVGWMWTARAMVSTGAPAYMRSRTAWIASSPSTPRIAAPRISRVSASASDLDEAGGLALLDGAADPRHRAGADEDRGGRRRGPRPRSCRRGRGAGR